MPNSLKCASSVTRLAIGDDNWEIGRCCSRHLYRRARCRNEHIGVELDEFSGQLRKSIRVASRPTRFDFDSLTLDITDVTQALA
jgi:hypothetical protein